MNITIIFKEKQTIFSNNFVDDYLFVNVKSLENQIDNIEITLFSGIEWTIPINLVKEIKIDIG